MIRIVKTAPRSGALECGDKVSTFDSSDAVSALQSGFAEKLSRESCDPVKKEIF